MADVSGERLRTFNNFSAQSNPHIIAGTTDDSMFLDARVHGTPVPSLPSYFSPSPMYHAPFGFTPFSENSSSARQIATLQAKLNKKLGPEYISQRPGPGGGPKLTYAEGWKIINLANEVFGFNGWSSSIVSISTDFIDYNEDSKKFNVGVTAIVRVTLRDGAYHEDVGYGMLENGKSKAVALDKCKKEAITDALKRTFRNFGNLLGNCLYDKSYAQEVVKIKVPPAKLDKSELYRRPEFVERIRDAPASSSHDLAVVPEASLSRPEEPRVKVEQEGDQPIAYVPRHLRQEMAIAARQAHARATIHVPSVSPAPPLQTHPSMRASASGSGATEAPINRDPPFADSPKPNGLATPIRTSVHAKCPPPSRAPPPRVAAPIRTPDVPERAQAVSFAEPNPIPGCTSSAGTTDRIMRDNGKREGKLEDEEEDAFPLSTQDNMFFATVDLGEGDFGRPIDFDEGVGGVSMMDTSELEPEIEPDNLKQSPTLPALLRDHAGSASNTGPSSSGQCEMNTRNEIQTKPSAKLAPANFLDAETNVRASTGAQESRSGSSNAASISSIRGRVAMQDIKCPQPAMIPTSGAHHPHGVKPTAQDVPKLFIPACVRKTASGSQLTGPTTNMNTLKRNVDVMQSGSGSSTRPPMQGMGLAQRQQQQQNANARRPSEISISEGHDLKRLKR